MIAVSATSDPRLGWYIYSVDTTFDCLGGYPCLPDQPLIGGNRDAFFISTNAFEESAPYNFDGANLYILDKTALIAGSFNELVNAAYIPMGQWYGTPDEGGIWYSIQPSFTASTGDWDNRMGGIEYALSSLEFFGTGDNRIALWALTNTQSIHAGPANWNFGLYWDIVPSEFYNVPYFFSGQADDGIYDFGYYNYAATHVGPIQPNDDRMNQVFQGPRHTLWSGLNTGLLQQFKGKPPVSSTAPNARSTYTEYHNGIAYFGITPKWDKQGNLLYDWVTQGYVAPAHEDALFPSIGMAANGHGAMTFTLTSGPVYIDDGGSPQYYGVARYPTAAYTQMNTRGAGDVFVSNAGMGSYDGSCEYNPACGGGVLRPRWGDYSAAVVMNNHVYIATEYIQYPECSRSSYSTDQTCGDTRSPRQNWGTSLDSLVP